MWLRMKNDPTVKNLRNHSPETVGELRALLTRGASASPDPRRKNFYELDGGSRVFYVHLSPVSGRVMLLAVWDNHPQGKPAPAQRLELAECCASNG
jgi:hypothetical protein